MKKTEPIIAVHGGAGTPNKNELNKEKESAYLNDLQTALLKGYEILQSGGIAEDAVVEAVKVLEDSPLFNAGRGSVFNSEGQHEMDACFASGENRKTGAIAGITRVRNPIVLARLVAEKTPHVFLSGPGAQKFAEISGVELMPDEWFFSTHRFQQWQDARKLEEIWLDHGEKKFGTVGAVARDKLGRLAAATSTGGMTNKRFGRVGDTPIFGTGTFADNKLCAISCTGHGEYFIRYVVAHQVASAMQYGRLNLQEAAWNVLNGILLEDGGEGGLIAIGPQGDPVLAFNCAGMFRAWVDTQNNFHASIF